MKKILTIITVFALCILLTGCNSTKTASNEIVVTTNGGVPYVWEYEIKDQSIIKFDNNTVKNLDPDSEGGRIEEHYTFKGLKKGTTTITFKYTDVRDNKAKETKEYKVTVDKDLNVTIKEK